tara:strand:+ start:15 stop:2135 length:2121 start_codon:yes stop_codon:yes gene_type:complete
MNKFGFSRITCGLAALLSPFAISTHGHTIIAYFNFGVVKQLIAIFLFPIAIGKLHGIIKNHENFVSFPFIIALMYLSHPFITYMFVIIMGLYLTILFFYERLKFFLIKTKKIIIIVILGFMLISFYLLPFFTSDEIKRVEMYSSGFKKSFDVTMFTTEEALKNLFSGSLLDRGDNLGKPNSYLWQNTNKERLPILTILLFIGLIFLILNYKKFEFTFFLVSFLFSFLFIMGPDDIFFLNYIPLQNQFQYIHSTPWLELNVFSIGAIGLASLFILGKKLFKKKSILKIPKVWIYLIFLVVVAALVATPMADRYKHASHQVDLKNFDSKDAKIISSSRKGTTNHEFKQVMELLKEMPNNGRVYGNPKNDYEFFYMTVLPYLTGKTNTINGAFASMTGGLNLRMSQGFRKDTGKNYSLMKLFNVRYLLFFNTDKNLEEIPTENLNLIKKNTKFSLYETKDDYGYFDFTEKPFLVFISKKNWTILNKEWLKDYMKQANLAEQPYLVKTSDYSILKNPQYLKNHFSGILLIDYQGKKLKKHYNALTNYLSLGGKIYSYENLFRDNNIVLEKKNSFKNIVNRLSEEYINQTTGSNKEQSTVLFGEINKRGEHKVSVESKKSVFIILKNSYYMGWKVKIDDKKTENFEISPGYNAVIVPSGKHIITYTYKGPNNFSLGILISLVSLVMIIILNRNKKLNKLIFGVKQEKENKK